MAEFDVFLSYASANLRVAEALEHWLQEPPRAFRVWRDRPRILPGAPDYYATIAGGIRASAAFVLLLSPDWLRSSIASRELSDAHREGKKVLAVVHSAIPRDPSTARGRERKAELIQAFQGAGLARDLEPLNWIWLAEEESSVADYASVEQALRVDFDWAAEHAVLVQRLHDWKAARDPGGLLRGAELSRIMKRAFVDAPNRQPVVTDEQREFLLESQRYEATERERVEGLYWGAQARSGAFAARERGEAEPDLALLLAAEAAAVASVPEARAALLSLLHRHAPLTAAIHRHGRSRWIAGVAFSPDGKWLASVDRPLGIGDTRAAQLFVHDVATGDRVTQVSSDEPLTAVAWGARWLAVASLSSIGWLRWDDWKERFRGNTPTGLRGEVRPEFLAFSPPTADLMAGELLAWGTREGDLGMVRVGDHARLQVRASEERSNRALGGLGWLPDGRLITAEGGRLVVRAAANLEVLDEIETGARIDSLQSDGVRWVATCVRNERLGVLLGEGTEATSFLPATASDLALTVARAGHAGEPWLVVGASARRAGLPAVSLWRGDSERETLLYGDAEQRVCVASDPSGRWVAAGEMRGVVWLWDRSRASQLVRRERADIVARCIAVSPSGATAIAPTGGAVSVFPAVRGSASIAEVAFPFVPNGLYYGDAGRVLLAVDDAGRVAATEADGRVRALSWPTGSSALRALAVARDAPVLAAIAQDGTISVCALGDGGLEPVRSIHPGGPCFSIGLDPLGERLYAVVAQLGVEVRYWQVDSVESEPVEVTTSTSGIPPMPMAFVGTSGLVAGDGDDVLLWPEEPPEGLIRLSGHQNPVKRVAAGAGLVASSACSFRDTSVDEVRLWTDAGVSLGPVVLPEHAVDIAIVSEGDYLLVLGSSGSLWRISLATNEWGDVARRIAGRGFTDEELRRYGVDAWRAT